jgi:hypothetical protein
MFSAVLFSWVQSAATYRRLHAKRSISWGALPPARWDALPQDSTTRVPLLDGCVVAVITHKTLSQQDRATSTLNVPSRSSTSTTYSTSPVMLGDSPTLRDVGTATATVLQCPSPLRRGL